MIEEKGRKYLFTGNMNLRFKDNVVDEHTAYQKELFLNTMNELRKHGPYDLAIFDVSDEASVGHFLKYCKPRHVFPIGKLNHQLVEGDISIYQPKYSNYIFEVKMYKGVIFDLDGTLLNSIDDLGNSVNRILLDHGFKPHTMDQYQYFVGNGVRKLVERAFPITMNNSILHLKSL